MPYEPPPELAALSLDEIARLMAERKLPPVETWAPTEIGDSEMRILADGRWFHQGGEIRRPAMVRAFASLLFCDDQDQHWLITPTQKLSIAVDDAAFIAIDVRQDAGSLIFRLNTDDLIVAGSQHPISAEGDPETPALYVAVRHRTKARLNRSTYNQLIEIAIHTSGEANLYVDSDGEQFSLLPT